MKAHFTYDKVGLTQQFINIVFERRVKEIKAGRMGIPKKLSFNSHEFFKRFTLEDDFEFRTFISTMYDFLRNCFESEKDVDYYLGLYIKDYNKEFITFGTYEEGEDIIYSIFKSKEFQKAFKESIKSRELNGLRGDGVYDRTLDEFFPCEFGSHFSKIVNIAKEYYPDKYEDIQSYMFGCREFDRAKEYPELDNFILENFKLIGRNHI